MAETHQISTDDGKTWHEIVPSTFDFSKNQCEEIYTVINAILTEKIDLMNGWVTLKFEDIFETTLQKEDADTLTIGLGYELKIPNSSLI